MHLVEGGSLLRMSAMAGAQRKALGLAEVISLP
jgi:hypothetical protein